MFDENGEEPGLIPSMGMYILCVTCEEYVALPELQGHRKFHEALNVFRIRNTRVSLTDRQLLKRRKQLIQEVQKTKDHSPQSPLPIKELEMIDKAYEFLRFRFDDNLHTKPERHGHFAGSASDTGSTTNSENVDFSVKMRCGQTVGICQDINVTWRSSMEDSYIAKDVYYMGKPIGCYGLFDGYNGPKAAEMCSHSFVDIFREHMGRTTSAGASVSSSSCSKNKEDDSKELKRIIKRSFHSMDTLLQQGRNEKSRVRWSGCSACVALVTEDTLYLANAGNIRGFIVKGDGSFERITSDHTPRKKRERHRIEKSNGRVIITSKTSLVNGLLSSTRGLGNHGDKELKKTVINKPHISKLPIEEGDQFIAMYTNGISQIFDEREIMLLLEDILPESTEINLLKSHYQLHSKSGAADSKPCDEEKVESKCENTESEMMISTSAGTDMEMREQTPEPIVEAEDKMLQDNAMEELSNNFQGDAIERDNTMYTTNKATALALTMSKRLVTSALLAGARENVSAMIILLEGCPIKLYLLPSKSS